MATTKPSKEPRSAAIEKIHAAYLEAEIRSEAGGERALRALAKRFGVPFPEVDRAATLDHWEMERAAGRALRWHREFGLGARSEEEYCRRVMEHTYSHLAADGPEGRRLAYAHGRDIWRRAMAPALEWEAARLLDEARADYEAIETVRKPLEAKRRERRAAGFDSDPVVMLREVA